MCFCEDVLAQIIRSSRSFFIWRWCVCVRLHYIEGVCPKNSLKLYYCAKSLATRFRNAPQHRWALSCKLLTGAFQTLKTNSRRASGWFHTDLGNEQRPENKRSYPKNKTLWSWTRIQPRKRFGEVLQLNTKMWVRWRKRINRWTTLKSWETSF